MGRRASELHTLERRTAEHYESFPFDFLTPADERAIEEMQPAPFRDFIEGHARAGQLVGEIGCGPGRGTMYLAKRGLKTVAVDISKRSIDLAKKRAPSATFVQATNLNLPFADGAFDLVVSDGVIHHTPDAKRSLSENIRVLRPGGHLYVGVYNRKGYYYYIYNVVGRPIRWLERFRIGKLIIYMTVFPLYYAVHLARSRGRRSLKGAKNFFYDYIITPQASFHTRDEIASWGAAEALELLDYNPSLGNVHVFVFRKNAAR